MSEPAKPQAISYAIAKIHANILALIFAVICGVGLFVMTVWLLIKGGEDVGSHLQLLGHYFIGYSVTWGGSLVGLLYGSIVGGISGWLIGWIYNLIVALRNP